MGVDSAKQYIYSFVFGNEVPITEGMKKGLTEGEEILAAYKGNKTLGIFTNKRIMYRGLLYGQSTPLIGKEIFIYTIPFKSVDYYACEYSDTTLLDVYKHVSLWTKGGNQISLMFFKDTDISKIRILLANCIL